MIYELFLLACFGSFLAIALGVGGLVLDAIERHHYRRAIERRTAQYTGITRGGKR